jgi:hypothetical protein
MNRLAGALYAPVFADSRRPAAAGYRAMADRQALKVLIRP